MPSSEGYGAARDRSWREVSLEVGWHAPHDAILWRNQLLNFLQTSLTQNLSNSTRNQGNSHQKRNI